MSTNQIKVGDGIIPLAIQETLLAVIPFVAFGTACLVSKLDLVNPGPPLIPFWQTLLLSPFLVFNWINLIGLGIGIYKGFPRWTYSYLLWALLFGWWWSNMSSFGYRWSGQIWLPFGAAVLIPLALKRSWQPLKTLASGLWQDWTLLALGMYIFYTFIYMTADENHNPYLLGFIAAATFAASLGAWGCFRLAGPLRRVLALLGGLLGAIALGMLSEATWDSLAYNGLAEPGSRVSWLGAILFVFLAAVMVGISLLERWRQRRQARMN